MKVSNPFAVVWGWAIFNNPVPSISSFLKFKEECMFENMKLRNRILLGYSVPVGLSVILAGVVFGSVANVSNVANRLQSANDIVDEADEYALAISELQSSAWGYLLQKTDLSRSLYNKAWEDAQKFSKLLDEAVKDPEQRKILADLEKLGNQTKAFDDRLIALVDAGNINEALAIWRRGEGTQLAVEKSKLLTAFLEKERNIISERRASQAASLSTLNAVVIIGTILSAIASIVLAYLISAAIAKQVRDSVSVVGSSSAEIAATLEQQDRTTSQQATSVNETTTTVEELGASSRQSAEQADASAAGAKEALAITENGLRSVEQTTTGLNNLKESVRGIAEQIMRLSEQTGQISGVTAVVADIANQTNMLALNAAVEAARAGEQGKGFAVVASEIRKLADESKKSAERIYQLVSDVQAAMNSTVMVTDEGTKTANSSIQLAQGTADAFNSVAEAVNSVFLNNQQIALSSKQQAVAVQQIVSAMNAINLGAKETSAGIAQVKTATNQVNQAAKNLVALT
jgi:methyl-accepting chemotaxis protein